MKKQLMKKVSMALVISILSSIMLLGGIVSAETVEPAKIINVVKNGDFDEGTFGWTNTQIATEIVTDSAVWGDTGNAVKVTVNKKGVWYDALLQKGLIPLAAATTYTISFKAKAEVAGKKIRAIVQEANTPYANIFNSTDLTLSTTEQLYSYTFTTPSVTAPMVNDSVYLKFGLGLNDVGSVIYIDKIKITHNIGVTRNLLIDGSFDTTTTFNGTSSWYHKNKSTSQSTIGIVNDSAFPEGNTAAIDITAVSSKYDILLSQTNIPMIAGKTYMLMFDARSSVNKDIFVYMQRDTEPWTLYGSATLAAITLTPVRSTFVIPVTATETTNKVAFVLAFGQAPAVSTVYIDNAKILLAPEQFAMTSATPANNTINVAKNIIPEFIFNNEVDETTLTTSNISIIGGTATIQSIAKNVDKKGFKVTFSGDLDFSTDYTMMISGVKDIYGQVLQSQTIMFTTNDPYAFGNSVFNKIVDSVETPILSIEPGNIKYSIDVTNGDTSAKPSVLALALYKVSNGGVTIQLADATISTIDLEVGVNNISANITVPNDANMYEIKAFLWNSLDLMQPLMSEKKLP